MKISIINSRSRENCTVVHNSVSALVLDAGVAYQKVLEVLGFDPNIEITLLVTHKHLDHSKYLNEFISRGVNVYISEEMFDEYVLNHKTKSNVHLFRANNLYSTKDWDFMPIAVEHDVPNYGFVCEHDDIGEFCYFTDTHYIPINLKNCRHFLVEANYCPEIIDRLLDSKRISEFQYARVRNSHMSIDETVAFLKRSKSIKMENIVLLHLSDGNSDAKAFTERVRTEIGITPIIGDKNMEINIGISF